MASSQESKHCKLWHVLEFVLLDNLMAMINRKEWVYDVITTLEDGLAMKMGNSLKSKSLKTSIDFLLITFVENNEVKVCGI